ncbi:MAG: POTRA domain-containing protein [Candidatus Electryoneaceae bacterium]|nr:POTRA domain-containing protein [Candidatus Electryoneaceae bacterium]
MLYILILNFLIASTGYAGSSGPVILNSTSIVGYEYTGISLSSGVPLTDSLLQHQASILLNDLTDNGYPFAVVTLVPSKVRNCDGYVSADVTFQVERGPFIRLRDIDFTGNRMTRKRLLMLESRLMRGSMFRQSDIERAIDRLERLSYIRYVGPIKLYNASPGVATVSIPVVERKVNSLSGILSVDPSNNKPTGELQVEFGNLLGTGRRLQFGWFGLNPQRHGIQLGYREPWLFGKPWHASFDLERWEQDSLSIITRYRVGLDWEPFDRMIGSGIVTDETINAVQEDDSGSQAVWMELCVTVDRFNHRWNPTDGYQLSFRSARGLRWWDDRMSQNRSVNNLNRETMTVQAVHRMIRFDANKPQGILFWKLSVEDLSGSGVVREDLIRIGGIGSIRGYAEENYLVRGIVCGTMELRWRPDVDGYFGLSADFGHIHRYDPQLYVPKRNLASVGITAMITTTAGRLGLNLALANGEPITKARLHIKLTGWF